MKLSTASSSALAMLVLSSGASVAAQPQVDTSEGITTIYSTIVHTVTVIEGSQTILTSIPLTTSTVASSTKSTVVSTTKTSSELKHSHAATTSARGLFAAALVQGNSTSSSANATSTFVSSSKVTTSSKLSTLTSSATSASASATTATTAAGVETSSAGSSNSGVKAVQISSGVIVGALIGLTINLI